MKSGLECSTVPGTMFPWPRHYVCKNPRHPIASVCAHDALHVACLQVSVHMMRYMWHVCKCPCTWCVTCASQTACFASVRGTMLQGIADTRFKVTRHCASMFARHDVPEYSPDATFASTGITGTMFRSIRGTLFASMAGGHNVSKYHGNHVRECPGHYLETVTKHPGQPALPRENLHLCICMYVCMYARVVITCVYIHTINGIYT
jgi:hypothetical protein